MNKEKQFIPETGELPIEDASSEKSVDADIFRSDANILRNKTFNKELRNLVTRIRDNEFPFPAEDESMENTGALNDEELLIRMHRLFYLVKNMKENIAGVSSYIPEGFEKLDKDGHILVDKSRWDREFKKISMPEYAFLVYDLKNKSYQPDLFSIESLDRNSIALSPRHAFLKKIILSEKGVILTIEDIKTDPWLGKIFQVRNSDPFYLYFVKTGALTRSLREELSGLKENSLSPLHDVLLMVKINESRQLNEKDLFKLLKQNLAIPFHSFDVKRFHYPKNTSYENMDERINILEYLLLLYSHYNDSICMVVRSERYYDKEIAFVLKFLLAKIREIIWEKSSIVNISPDLFLVLTRKTELEKINEIINEQNTLFKGNFTLQIYGNQELSDPLFLLERVFTEIN